MFSPVRMTRLEALLLKSDARAALLGLGAAGVLELAESAELPAAPGFEKDRARECAALLERLAELKTAAGAVGGAPPEGEITFEEARAGLDLWENRARELFKLRAEQAEALKGFSAAAEKIRPYSALPLPSSGLDGFRYLYCAAGTLPAEAFPAAAAGLPAGAVLLRLAEKEGRVHAVALGLRPAAGALAAGLESRGFRPEALPGRPGTTLAGLAEYYLERERSARAGLERTGIEIRGLGALPLAAAERAMVTEKLLLDAEGGLGHTGATALISGWAPADAAGEAARCLAGATHGRCALEAKPPGSGADIPVLLRPPRQFRPFAALVAAYGLPRYGEVEPTVFAAVSFLLMFGIMFGDAGHGAVVCLGGLALGLRGRGGTREAGRVVFACGLSAVFFGVLYGSFFGMEEFKSYALWRDPLGGDPLLLLKAALGAGVAVISLGLILNIANRLRAGDPAGAALGRFGFAGLVFYLGGVSLAAGCGPPRELLVLMGLAAGCWVVREPAIYLLRRSAAGSGEGFAGVAAESLVGAFEGALLYLANTVSFVRLAAYAMSHAALLAAAWALRDAADKIFGQGSAAGLLAVIACNAAAIGLEGLVAFVQALRLEYYEFFSKFLEGAGRPFRPFTLEIKGG